ncbi:MFS transporter [Photobacterium sp. WH77]|uniref:MFS transporter n=1 Tax=unclassified Photobacterium TaxID=2628852 RepID=UPI001EDAF5F2|nr:MULTISPECIES: MFS transporter [unclassified Photobacterium]MCG2839057.1 MFS transporter [Photobacterium sp. WH77]MCG2846674.1 MFS transporter [Photobacterium sp. WH80]MDO6582513.1 MFS transporter [Photobacterium sp. 2_MG-2023]
MRESPNSSQAQFAPQIEAKTDYTLLLTLLMAMALPMLILYASGALAPLMLADEHINAELLGMFTLAAFGVAALLSAQAGRWVRKWGLRRSATALFLLTGVSFAALVLFEHWFGMLIAIAVCGVSQALANPVTNQAIALQVPPARKAFMVGVKQSGVQLSALAAGSVLSLAASLWGWRTAFAFVIPLCLLMAFLAAGRNWKPKVHAAPPPARGEANRAWLLYVMQMQASVGITLAAFITQVPAFASQSGMSARQAAFLITLFGLMGILSRLVLTPLASRLRHESDLLIVLYAIAAIALVVTFGAGTEHLWMIYAGVAGIGGTLVATNSVAMAMIIKYPGFGEVPVASGKVSMAFFGGIATGSLLFQGVVLLAGSLYAGVGLLLACLISCIWAAKRLRASVTKAGCTQ